MFMIAGLEPSRFAPYFQLAPAALAALGARRVIADGPGYPCRVSLVDAAPGEELLLCAYQPPAVAPAYRASGPIYVRRAALETARHVDEIPEALRRRLLSVRAYDRAGDLQDAEVISGDQLATLLATWFARRE